MRNRPSAAPSAVRLAHPQAGVTLIELIVVITISGIIATMLAYFIVGPVEGYRAQVRRGQLVDAAEMAVRRMARDIRQALPNSVRVDPTGHAIEMLNTPDGARYRDGPGQGPLGTNYTTSQYWLSFSSADSNGFNIVGSFQNIALPFTSNKERLVIYNQGTPPGVPLCSIPNVDAYCDAALLSGRSVISYASTKFTINAPSGGGDEENVSLSGSVWFPWRSPYQRIFVVDTPITYLCSPGSSGNITRYWNYSITGTPQPTDPTQAPLNGGASALLTQPVTACNFSYQPGTNQRAGLVTLDITVGDAESGDRVRLLYQVHVDNSP